VTAAQRLRLVLALGVVNLVLAAVVLGVGITGVTIPTGPGAQPSSAIALIPPPPTTPGGAGATSSPASSLTPGTAAPSLAPTPGPSGLPTSSSQPASPEPASPEPAASPSIEPSLAPSAAPSVPSATPAGGPIAVVAHPGNPGPAPTPRLPSNSTPTPGPTPEPTPVGITAGPPEGPGACPRERGGTAAADVVCVPKVKDHGHAAKPKAAHHKKIKHHPPTAHGPHADQGRHQEATVGKPRRGPKTGHRLRMGRRAR
jgi:hypothetical protein